MMAMVFWNVVQVSVTVSVVALMLLALRALLHKRYSARILCVIWLLLAIRLLVPVQWTWHEAAVTVSPTVVTTQYSVSAAQVVPVVASEDAAPAARPAPEAMKRTSSAQWLAWLWSAGVLVALCWQIVVYGRFHRAIRRGQQSMNDKMLCAIYTEECERLRLKRPPQLVQTQAVQGPALFGVVRPQLLLPVAGVTVAEAPFVFRHELLHYKRRDLWLKYALRLAQCLHWFDPLLILMRRAADEDMELACDQAVAKALDDGERYQYGCCILRTAAVGSRWTTSFSDKEGMKLRLTELMSHSVKKRGRLLLVAILAVVLVMGSSFAFGEKEQAVYHYQDERYGFTLEIPEEIWQGVFRVESVVERLSGAPERIDAVGFDYCVLKFVDKGFDTGGLLFAIELYPQTVGASLSAEGRSFLAVDSQYAYYFWRAQPDGVAADFDELLAGLDEAIDDVPAGFVPGENYRALVDAANAWGEAMVQGDREGLLALTSGETEDERRTNLMKILGRDDLPPDLRMSSPRIGGFAIQNVSADERIVTVVYDWYAGSDVGSWRSVAKVYFAEDELKVVRIEEKSAVDGQVTTLEQFEQLYGNDLGLPTALTRILEDGAVVSTDDVQLANNLPLAGGTWLEQVPYSVDNKTMGTVATYQFADKTMVRLLLVGDLLLDWQREDGSNCRTMTDLADQWARGLAYKDGRFRYPILSEREQEKFVQARREQNSDEQGHWGWKIGGSSPSVRSYVVLADTDKTMRIVYEAWDSIPISYRFEEILTFQRDAAGRLVVADTSQGYDYVPNIPPIRSLEEFVRLYDNPLGLPHYTQEQLTALQKNVGDLSADAWLNLSGGTLGTWMETDGSRYVPYRFADGSSVVLTLQAVMPDNDMAPLWMPIAWEAGHPAK